MKKTAKLLAAMILTFGLVARAAAQQTPAASHQGPSAATGLRLTLLSLGNMSVDFSGHHDAGKIPDVHVDQDMAMSFGLSPFFDVHVLPYLAIGIGPELFLNVVPDGEDDPAKSVNLNLRLKGMYPLMDRLTAYLLLTPGYSILIPAKGDNSTGPILGFAGGASYTLTQTFGVFTEAGMILDFQSIEGAEARLTYMQINLGAQFMF